MRYIHIDTTLIYKICSSATTSSSCDRSGLASVGYRQRVWEHGFYSVSKFLGSWVKNRTQYKKLSTHSFKAIRHSLSARQAKILIRQATGSSATSIPQRGRDTDSRRESLFPFIPFLSVACVSFTELSILRLGETVSTGCLQLFAAGTDMLDWKTR